MFELIKKTFPKFPDEVIKEWLLPFAEEEGWPPRLGFDSVPLDRWRYLLGLKPFNVLKNLDWKEEYCHISIHDIEPNSQKSLIWIFESAILGKHNSMSNTISDLENRFKSVVKYIQSHGKMPKPPVLYFENGKYFIFDGNHRLSAYYYAFGYFKVEVKGHLLLKTQKGQHYWIAY